MVNFHYHVVYFQYHLNLFQQYCRVYETLSPTILTTYIKTAGLCSSIISFDWQDSVTANAFDPVHQNALIKPMSVNE